MFFLDLNQQLTTLLIKGQFWQIKEVTNWSATVFCNSSKLLLIRKPFLVLGDVQVTIPTPPH